MKTTPNAKRAIWLTTERLALRRFTSADLDWLAELYSDGDVTRYLGGVKSRSEAREFLDTRILQYYDEHPGLGIWMTVERATGMARVSSSGLCLGRRDGVVRARWNGLAGRTRFVHVTFRSSESPYVFDEHQIVDG